MYLHHLTLQAIGPFADRVDIDVAQLGASGVFLLEGPTGSGKSTIIDAVVFALYGSLAGDAAGTSKDRLHSHHADAATEPFVELVFETGAGIHRVRRTPAYERPKQRGSGTVKQQASARLWRLAAVDDPVGEPLSETTQEIGAEIARVVGLDRAQFVQTVVLPQGEFARFLRAPGEVRRELLQSLFGTEVYVRTADELAARRRAAVASVEQAERAVADALGRFEEASGTADLAETDAATIVAGLESASALAEQQRADAVVARAQSADALADAVRRSAALRRRDQFVARQVALAATTDDVARTRTRLADAERAGRVLALLVGLDTARSSATRHDDARTAVLEQHGSSVRRLVDRVVVGGSAGVAGASWHDGVDPAVLLDRVDGLRSAASGARHLVDAERRRTERLRASERLADELQDGRDRRAALDRTLGSRDADRGELVAAAERLASGAADAAPADRALADAQAAARRIVALDAARERLDLAERARTAAADAARAAIDHESALRRRRTAGLAGELGAALAADDACPVCGSHEHPAVARPLDDHPDADAVDAAADARAAADVALALAATEHALASGDRDRLAIDVGDATAQSVLDEIERAGMRVDRARAAESEHATAITAVSSFDRQSAALESERTAVIARVAAADATLQAERAAIEIEDRAISECVETLRRLRAGDPEAAVDAADAAASGADAVRPLAHVVELVEADAAVLTAVAEVLAAARTAEHEFERRAIEVADALAEQGFVDADGARAAALRPADGARLRELVAAADRESAVVAAVLQEPEIVAAADDTLAQIDHDGVEDRDRVAAESLERTTAAAATAAERAAKSVARASDLARSIAARESTSAASRAVVRLADIAAAAPGVNPTGITLATYVLMRRFEDVVAAANSRLGAMLGGRFTLQASDERESSSRARRTGLALAVLDHETGRSRDPKSLSGGETFTTSLCLALGLADVVQAEAGGVELGTLFVDEGFGTLDSETLDGVIGQLGQLTAGGRQVGIVSHVEELKQRIPDRIEVRRTPGGGSRVTTTL
ncbi:AAA family ATPase [Curtobacterium sp. RRHDQ10]|uniref:AAA family ATPase n=1 Tax=Curtobacterium phyllosphaerae TaxID=3413379 RepID=UPI003BF29E2F